MLPGKQKGFYCNDHDCLWQGLLCNAVKQSQPLSGLKKKDRKEKNKKGRKKEMIEEALLLDAKFMVQQLQLSDEAIYWANSTPLVIINNLNQLSKIYKHTALV